MKADFSIINGFTCGLNQALKRKTSRFFSSFTSAFSALNSSEDEALLPNDSSVLPTSLNCFSADRISEPFDRKCNHAFRYRGYSAPKCQVLNSYKMEVLKVEQEQRSGDLNFRGVDFVEENIIRQLTCLFEESSNSALALHFFRWTECTLGVRSICTLIRILVLGNMNHRAIDLVMYLVHGHPEHVQPDELVKVLQEICPTRVLETVCSMLVKCYIMKNMIDEAVRAICQMKKADILPSPRVCNLLLKTLLESNQEELAWDLLEEMHGQGLVSVAIITVFIRYYCSKGNLLCAWKLMMDMKKYGTKPDVVAYTTLINSLCKLSYLKEATCLVFKMIQMGIPPDSVLLTLMVDGYCKVARPGDALHIIKLFDVRPNIFLYNSFISKLCVDGHMENASTVFQEMLDFGIRPDCFSYTTMIGGYCKAGKTRKVLQLLGRMLKDGIQPSIATYTILIDMHCRSGNMEIAKHLLHKMVRKGLIPDVVIYNTLINGYKDKGQFDKALELLDIMRFAGVSPDVVTYNTIIHGLIMRGFVSEAKGILDELIEGGFSPDVVTLTNVIGGYSNKGQFEEALLVWSCMTDHNIKPDVITCNVLLNGFCRANLMDEARILFHKMLGVGLVPDLILYNTLIHGFCRIGNIEDACHLINMMVENHVIPNDVTYRALIRGYEKKAVGNPMESAAYKLQNILQKHGMDVDFGQF